jgi:hypothetical protein
MFFARVEQLSWIAATEDFLKGEPKAPLAFDLHQSPLSMWMNTESLANQAMQSAFGSVNALHRQIQTLSTELCNLQIPGQNTEALARLEELHDL